MGKAWFRIPTDREARLVETHRELMRLGHGGTAHCSCGIASEIRQLQAVRHKGWQESLARRRATIAAKRSTPKDGWPEDTLTA